MNEKTIKLFATFISLMVIMTIGCEKRERNQNPIIYFLQPDTNVMIVNDTTISFIVEADDPDGSIDRVEFSVDETIVGKISASPYRFDWSVTTEDNVGIKSIKATAYDNDGAKAEAEFKLEIKSYLTKWLGHYEGESSHSYSHLVEIDSQYQFVEDKSFKKVSVHVEMGDLDSSLYFEIVYNDTIIDTKEDLVFSTSGTHASERGGGSGYSSLNICFKSDSLHYHYFQKCGMVCSSSIGFDLEKNKKD